MAKVKFSRTEDNDVSSIQIVDGQLIYTKTGKCYLDYGAERIEIVSGGDTLPIGTISSFADVDENSPLMSDWILCDGRAISRTTYSELFNIIGTKYGQGDGINTFNVPNLEGKSLVGLDVDDADFNEVGKTGGSKTHTQTWSEMPQHTHYLNYGAVSQVQGGEINGLGGGGYWSDGVNLNIEMSNSGSGTPMDIMNPYTVVKFYIKAFKSASSTAQVKNTQTTSSEDTYSCNYINNMQVNIITNGSPVKTGRKVDGKDEYIKRIGIAQLPNASALEVDTGLNINEIVVTSIECLAYRSSDKSYIPIPFISMANSHIGLNTKVNSNILYLLIETTIDRSDFSGWAEIRFVYE